MSVNSSACKDMFLGHVFRSSRYMARKHASYLSLFQLLNDSTTFRLFQFRSISLCLLGGQLFCSASGQFTAPHIQWTRNNITIPETAQLPHLMVKSRTENNTITSSLLTIYGFSSSDNGSYQCVACDNNSCDTSIALLLSG